MPLQHVRARAPATCANLGPGYDVFGLALAAPHDDVDVQLTPGEQVRVQHTGPYATGLPVQPARNAAGAVALRMLRDLHRRLGLRIHVHKGVPTGRGLGSSGATAAATALAMARLLRLRLSARQLIESAAEGEAACTGAAHADNVAPALLGGFTVIRSYEPFDCVAVAAPQRLRVCVATPLVPVPRRKTARARALVPRRVSMPQMVHTVGHAATVALGFATGNLELIGRGMHDVVVEPARAPLLPGYAEVRAAAVAAGAVGVAVSGAGPTVVALVDGQRVAPRRVSRAMKEGFRQTGLDAEVRVTRVGGGARVVVAE